MSNLATSFSTKRVLSKSASLKARISGYLEASIQGIPCLIEVDTCNVVKGNSRADNPNDYYGYADIEFTVYDRKGYRAVWLEKKMTDEDREAIEEKILKANTSNGFDD
jgi:hypothetical protein